MATQGMCHTPLVSKMSRAEGSEAPDSKQVNALMAAARLLVALSVRSLGVSEDAVTLVQLRMLVVLASQGPTNLSSLAEAVGVHASNASRTCDALVKVGLVDRHDDPNDRRHVVLAVRDEGRKVVQAVLDRRRELSTDVLAGLSASDREALVGPLERLVEVAGDVPVTDIWSVG